MNFALYTGGNTKADYFTGDSELKNVIKYKCSEGVFIGTSGEACNTDNGINKGQLLKTQNAY